MDGVCGRVCATLNLKDAVTAVRVGRVDEADAGYLDIINPRIGGAFHIAVGDKAVGSGTRLVGMEVKEDWGRAYRGLGVGEGMVDEEETDDGVGEGSSLDVGVGDGRSLDVGEGSSLDVGEGSSLDVGVEDDLSLEVGDGASLEVEDGSIPDEGTSLDMVEDSTLEVGEAPSFEVVEAATLDVDVDEDST